LNFKEAVLDPEIDLFKKVNGITKYEYFGKDPQVNQIFNKSMTNMTKIHMNKILEIYKGYEGVSTLVDIGGGNGQTLKMIIAKYPSIKGINFDLPQVIENVSPIPGTLFLEITWFYVRQLINFISSKRLIFVSKKIV